jgi:hypothetical protein
MQIPGVVKVVVNMGQGNDVFDASRLSGVVLDADGGAGNDILIGGYGLAGVGGTLRGGRAFEFDKKDENRKLCRLHLALMERMGVKTERFGDADKPLPDLV